MESPQEQPQIAPNSSPPSVANKLFSYLKVFVIIYVAILLLGFLGAYLNVSGLPSKSFLVSFLLNAIIIFQPFTALGWFSFFFGPLLVAIPLSFVFRAISKHAATQMAVWSKWLLLIGGIAIIFIIYNFLWKAFIGLLFLDSPQIVSIYQSEISSWGLIILVVLIFYAGVFVLHKLGKYKWSLGISVILLAVGAVYLLYTEVNAKAKWETDQQQLQTINK